VEWRAWREDPTQVRLPGVEAVELIADRMEAGCREWLARGGEGVIVSHQDPIAALLCRLVGMPLRSMRSWEIRTGSIAVVRLTPYGVAVEAVNAGVPLTL
jgi:broad specificity phosphatase PhoE